MKKIFNKIVSNYKIIVGLFSIFFFLFWLYFESLINSFWLSFNFLFFSENSAEWFQVLWWVWSLIVALVVWYLTISFHKFMKINNSIALEEFRPNVVPEKSWENLILKNIWSNESLELDYYISTTSRDWNKSKLKLIEKNIILVPNWKHTINRNWYNWLFSIIFKYKNPTTWNYYFSWFNHYSWNNFLSVWESHSNIESPIKKYDYISIYNKLNIKNQIINNIDFNWYLNKFIEKHQ